MGRSQVNNRNGPTAEECPDYGLKQSRTEIALLNVCHFFGKFLAHHDGQRKLGFLLCAYVSFYYYFYFQERAIFIFVYLERWFFCLLNLSSSTVNSL